MAAFAKNMVGRTVLGTELNKVINPKDDTETPSWEVFTVWNEPRELLRDLEAEDGLWDVASGEESGNDR